MTKEQERQALKKIEKIFKELGDESYVVKAFEGCAVIAEQNIDNDFFCSMKERAEAAERDAHNMGELVNKQKGRFDEMEKEIENLERKVKMEQENAEYWRTQWKAKLEKLKEANEQLDGYEKKIAEQERTIIELKAKLYDLIVKQ